MANKPAFRPIDFLLLLVVLAVAAGTRVGYLMALADSGTNSGPLIVQDLSPVLPYPSGTELRGKLNPTELDALVHNVHEHQWFGCLAPFASTPEERTAHTSPGYPWLLGWLAGWMGADDLEPVVRWIQCGLGVLTVGLYFLFARRTFNSRLVAGLAGFLTALHPFWIINTAAINDGTVTTFLLALVLFLGSVAGRSGSSIASLLYGVTVAGLALMRAALLPFSFVAILWLLWRSRKVEGGWLCALLAFLGFGIGLAPWMVRNYQLYHEPVPVVTSAYLHLWEGNNSHATGGPRSEGDMLEALAQARGETVSELRAKLSALPQPARYRQLAGDVLGEIRRDPTGTIFHRLSAAAYFLFSEKLIQRSEPAVKVADSELPAWFENGYVRVLLGSLVLMLLLALFGWRWTYPWRGRAMLATLALIWVPLPYILGHAGALHGPRLPLDGVLLTYAAFALANLWPATARKLEKGPKDEAEPRP